MSKREGFTLIELLVVISIIALLLAILMPALAKVRKQAKNVACQSNLKQWALIYSMYTSDNKNLFPEDWHIDREGCWVHVLRPYYQNEKLQLCPMAVKPVVEGGRHPYAAWGGTEWGKKYPYYSYGQNDWILSTWPGIPAWQKDLLWKTSLVRRAAEIPIFLDATYPFSNNPMYTDNPPEYNGDNQWSTSTGDNMKRFCLDRHNMAVNSAFMDWSVRKVGLKGLWDLKWHRMWNLTDADPPVWPEWMDKQSTLTIPDGK